MILSFLKKWNKPRSLNLLGAILFALLAALLFNRSGKSDLAALNQRFEKTLHEKIARLESFSTKLSALPLDEIEHYAHQEYAIHVFSRDSLVYWNTNQMPVWHFADFQFPAEGLVHLQNGWYYSNISELGNQKLVLSFPIQRDFAYENRDLNNDFTEDFEFANRHYLEVNPEIDGIRSPDGSYLVSLLPKNENPDTKASIFLLGSIALMFVFLFRFFYLFGQKLKSLKAFLVYLGAIALIWFLFYLIPSQRIFEGYEFVDPILLANAGYAPNLLSFSLHIDFLSLLLFLVVRFFEHNSNKAIGFWSGIFIGLCTWHLFNVALQVLVQDSNIPLQIDQIFQLNFYTFFSVGLLGLLFLGIFSLFRYLGSAFGALVHQKRNSLLIAILLMILFAILELVLTKLNLFSSCFPLLLFVMVLLWNRPSSTRNHFTQGLSYLFLFSLCFATSLSLLNIEKEKGERKVFAEQLRTDRDMVSELEFSRLREKIQSDDYILKVLNGKQTLFVSDFVDAVERRVFDDFWERYDMDFFLFDDSGKALVDNLSRSKYELDAILNEFSEPSKLSKGLFYISRGFDEFAYLMKLPILQDGQQIAEMYGTFKSKRIPEEIGFPRLLISKSAKVFEPLENYSIAKYYRGKLISKHGKFSYPTKFSSFQIENHEEQAFYELEDFSHYVIHREEGGHLVLSAPKKSSLDLLTNFSYLFSFFGLLILPTYIRRREKNRVLSNLTLAMKIQLVMISLVFVSLLVYGFGSGMFVKNQYNEYTNEVINEKLASVRLEFQSKFGKDSLLTVQSSGNRMEYYLRKFARVFVTDINFYNPKGYLVATSRPRMFNVGLISEQMNPSAVDAMIYGNESSFIHQEQIGELSYASAYLPFVGNDGELKGYLNLQHFGQQQDFENQIQRFLMAIVNVFMFLLAASVIVAVVVSGWLTAPLHLIQARFSKVNFGELNEPIEYDKEDEIGALIKEYNLKINELALTAQQLAQSERESAWREMAKQVAHEIKNPLTPMKLRLQHFQRLYSSGENLSTQQVDEIVESLVEQIDGLTRIANEFSNFAKMPTPNEEPVDLESLVRSQISLFKDVSSTKIELGMEGSNFELRADKNMLIRILNNLIKNSQQATNDSDNPEILVTVCDKGDHVLLKVQDNGSGIPESEIDNIFVPYFTTKSTGTGLGLAMVKQMVELHGGKIWFSSVVGEGTIFYIEFPKR